MKNFTIGVRSGIQLKKAKRLNNERILISSIRAKIDLKQRAGNVKTSLRRTINIS